MPNPAVIKAAVALLSDERARKGIGWIIAAILSPVIVLLALLCSLASGSSGHNAAVVELCFNGGVPPSNMPAEYAACIKDMQDSFALLDGFIEDINEMTEEGNSLLQKMDAYCQQQTGQSLKEYSAQCMAEDMAPPAGPVM